MSDTIGPDGLTDEERRQLSENRKQALDIDAAASFLTEALVKLAASRLAHAAEKAAHAETQVERDRLRLKVKAYDYMGSLQARAEKAEAERDAARSALATVEGQAAAMWTAIIDYIEANGSINKDAMRDAAYAYAARALLGEVKP